MSTQEVHCPLLDPAEWDRQILEWKDKRLIKAHVRTVLFAPVDFGEVMQRLSEKIAAEGATSPDELCPSDHTSESDMDIYFATDREIPDADNVLLSGRFLSKVYEGPFSDTGKRMSESNAYADEEGLQVKKLYMWYATCPDCAKKYGKNYVVVVAQVQS